jgi:hypothetical protein
MIAGMTVVHQGRVKIVRAIQAPTPGFTPTPRDRVVYTLQAPGGDLEYVKGPMAVDVPLLPACPEHGADAGPGQRGSAGWPCWTACQVTAEERAALL